ncbi:hypothetical protein [Nonomuraea sp. NPDC050783]|uniref:hypothetical protein n=1 Tax=Nonomuraea sp. NPDC050783 TaxID=3154634 RepID=UPI00346562AE
MSDAQGRRPSKVEVELAGQPAGPKARSPRAGRATSKELTWSGTMTAKAHGSRHTLQVPAGKLKKGRHVRWRARATVAGGSGGWPEWQP